MRLYEIKHVIDNIKVFDFIISDSNIVPKKIKAGKRAQSILSYHLIWLPWFLNKRSDFNVFVSKIHIVISLLRRYFLPKLKKIVRYYIKFQG